MRSRFIRPGFFKNEELAELDPLARILFAGLWCLADRAGRLEDRPKRIKAEVLPYDDCNIDATLNILVHGGFIHRYEVRDERYIQVTNWKHQTPHHTEAVSLIPEPDGFTPDNGDYQEDNGYLTVNSPLEQREVTAVSYITNPLLLNTGEEEEDESSPAPARTSTSVVEIPFAAPATDAGTLPEAVRERIAIRGMIEQSILNFSDRTKLTKTIEKVISKFFNEYSKKLTPEIVDAAEIEVGTYTSGDSVAYFLAVMRRMIEDPERGKAQMKRATNGHYATTVQARGKSPPPEDVWADYTVIGEQGHDQLKGNEQ